ncbi:MAG: Rab family GTPase [Promethearchaeota archaeon]
MSDKKKTYKFKVTLFGTANVGKTSLILRFIKDSYAQDLKKTIGTNFLIKDVILEDANIRLLVWDIGGQAQFSNMRSIYFKGSNAALGVYDITSPESLLKIPGWVTSIKKSVGKIPMVLLGNKIDLATEQQRVDEKESLDLAKKLECEHMYTSALTGKNVEEAFIKIAKKILEIARSFE